MIHVHGTVEVNTGILANYRCAAQISNILMNNDQLIGDGCLVRFEDPSAPGIETGSWESRIVSVFLILLGFFLIQIICKA